MAASAFRWDPSANQVYNGPTRTLTGAADSFNKDLGTSFVLDAPLQTLTLQVTDADILADGITLWGWQNTGLPAADETAMTLKNGTLVYNGAYTGQALSPTFDLAADPGIPSAQIAITVSGDSSFQILDTANLMVLAPLSLKIQDTGSFTTSNTPSIEIKPNDMPSASMILTVQDGGLVDIECNEFEGPVNGSSLSGNASVSITAYDWLGTGGSIVLSEQSRLLLKSSGGMKLFEAQLYLQDDAEASLYGESLMCSGGSSIYAGGNVCAEMHFNTITLDEGCRFSLSAAEATFRIESFTPENQPFDFLNGTYPQGIFNFVTSRQAINNSEFVIKTFGEHAIPYMLFVKKLISIDGVPVDENHENKILCQIETDAYLHIRLFH